MTEPAGTAHAGTAHAGRMVAFPSNGRGASGYLALPPGDGPNGGRGPGVLVLQEWWGLVGHIRAVADRVAAAYLRGLDAVRPKRVGVVGFCMGGQLALYAAAAHPDVIDACVDFYGIHPNVHPPLDRLRAPVLGHFGREDRSVPPERAAALFADLRARGVDAEYHVYEAGHAFANDARPQVYNVAAADEAWRRTFAFFGARLELPR